MASTIAWAISSSIPETKTPLDPDFFRAAIALSALDFKFSDNCPVIFPIRRSCM